MADASGTTVFLAVWGAIISTLNAGWTLYRDIMRRGRLRVSCDIRITVTPGVGIDRTEKVFWYIVNIGQEPVLVKSLGGRMENGNGFIVNQSNESRIPGMLEPGHYMAEVYPFTEGMFAGMKTLGVFDSLDRFHKVSRKQLAKLKTEKLAKNSSGPKTEAK